jgi:hypothetical protein
MTARFDPIDRAAPPSGGADGLDRRAIGHVRALLATWRGRFIALFVASQLLLPLHYYLLRRDPHDERFAWRMFSPTRMTTCDAKLARDGAPIAIGREFHDAWLTLARRGRFSVIEAMAARLCRKKPGSTVAVSLACKVGDEPAGTWSGRDLCTSPEL